MTFTINFNAGEGTSYECDPQITYEEDEKNEKINLLDVAQKIQKIFEDLSVRFPKSFLEVNSKKIINPRNIN